MNADTEISGKVGVEILRRGSMIAIGAFYIYIGNQLWNQGGYINLISLTGLFILLFSAALLFILAFYGFSNEKWAKRSLLIAVLPGILAIFISFSQFYPTFGTDEIAIDNYSAYLFLHGVNPYIYPNVAKFLSFSGLPGSYVTPELNGGHINYIQYPGLSVLLFIPSALFSFPPFYIVSAFYLAMFPITYYYFRKINKLDFFPYAALIFMININAIYYALGGITDAVWITFFALSYIFRKNYIISAIFLGLAFGFKQIVLVIIPFYLIFLYKEELKSYLKVIKYLIAGGLTFLVVNLPFIITAPISWATSVLGVATQPVIGNGIGISILSFAGFFPVEIFVYYVLTLIAFMLMFVLYLRNYEKMKYSFLAFPVLIFFFYYRLLLNYFMYWPFIMVVAFPDYFDSIVAKVSARRNDRKEPIMFLKDIISKVMKFIRARSTGSIVLVAVLISSGVTFYGYVEETHNPLSLDSVNNFSDPYMVNNSITSMNVKISYLPQSGQPSSIPVYFRIYMYNDMSNGNGLLWSASNNQIGFGTSNITIYPEGPADLLPDNISFRLIAYYGNFQSSIAESGKVAGFYGLNNPELLLPVNHSGCLVPFGWNYFPREKNDYSFTPGNLTLAISSELKRGNYTSSINNPAINISRLRYNEIIYSMDAKVYINTNETNINKLAISNISFGINLTFDNGKNYMIFEENATGTNSPQLLSQNAILFPSLNLNFTEIFNYASSSHWDIQSSLTNMKIFINENNNDINASVSFFNIREVQQ